MATKGFPAIKQSLPMPKGAGKASNPAKSPLATASAKKPSVKSAGIQPAQMKSVSGKTDAFTNATTGRAFKGGGKVKC